MPYQLLLNSIKTGNVHAAEEILRTLSNHTNPTLQEVLNSDHGSEAGLVEQEIPGIPLFVAVFNNDVAMVALLLQYGANPSFFREDDCDKRDALAIALITLNVDTHRLAEKTHIIDLLCLHGATLKEDALDEQILGMVEILERSSPERIAFKRSILQRVFFEKSFSVLIDAIANNEIATIKKYLENTIRVFHPYKKPEEVFCTINLNDIKDPSHAYYGMAILEASCLRDLSILQYLHEKRGFSLNVHDSHGNTPLHYATIKNNYEIMGYLLEKGADRDALNHNQEKPLTICTNLSSQLLLVRYWPESGIKPDAEPTDESPQTLYQYRLNRFLSKNDRPTSPLLWRDKPENHMVPDSNPSDDGLQDNDEIKRVLKKPRII